MKYMQLIILTFLILAAPSLPQNGRIERVTVYSQSIEGNLLGDAPNRNVSVYLPHQYDSNPTDRFPVIYMLHGYGGTDSTYIESFDLVTVFNVFF